MPKEKITYILGAGASVNAHALARTATEPNRYAMRLIDFVSELEAKNPGDYYNELKRIARNCLQYGSPDTYAKFLYERDPGNDDYRLLKLLISNYFEIKEFVTDNIHNDDRRSIEQRVLPFLTYITNQKKLAENIRIISWNYDRQFEIAADTFRLRGPKTDYFPGFAAWPNSMDGHPGNELPFLIHMNGVSGYRYNANGHHFCERMKEKVDWVVDFKPTEPLISYAWEDRETDPHNIFLSKRKEIALKMAAGTTILVVIGYSFPFFNRFFDNELFESIKGTLKKIYFQDPNDGQYLYNQFNLVRKGSDGDRFYKEKTVEIVPINNLNNYFVPFEL